MAPASASTPSGLKAGDIDPQTGKKEPNGTSIIDVTNPKQPKYLIHLPGEPKDPAASHLVTLYDAFATPGQAQTFRAALMDGLGWGDRPGESVD